jgi:aspartyl protease family protein
VAFWLIAVIVALTGLFVVLESGVAGLSALPAWVIAAAVIAILSTAYFAATRNRSIEATRPGMMAGALLTGVILIALGAVTVLSQRTVKDLVPGTSANSAAHYADNKDGPRAVRLRKGEGGQFTARAEVNGANIDLIVDTGASAVVLKHADAEKAGIDTSALTFSTPVETGNGTAYAAPVRLRSITIGPLRLEGVEALVAKPGSVNESLLGMSFLRRLRSYDMAGDFLTLRQ